MYDIFYVSKLQGNDKDWQLVKSKYPTATRLSNITKFDQIKSKAFTKMFWVIWDDITLNDQFDISKYRATKWDDMYVHVFKNGEYFDGLCLFPKSLEISQREFYHRFFTEKKEIDILASYPKRYPIYTPITHEEYLSIQDDMFWLLWPGTKVINDDVLNLYFSHHNTYDRRENHMFKNLCNTENSYFSGLALCSKFKPISKKEFDSRYFVDRKEHDIVATTYNHECRYNRYTIKNYEEYQTILRTETSQMFWAIWPEIEITDSSVFDLYFDPYNSKYQHDRKENHIFKHNFNDQEIYVNGVTLFSKDKPISQREFHHRFLIEKKEHDKLVSKHKIYDVIFISYNESNADENYEKLTLICPRAKRVHGIKGIHQAHIKAAEMSSTEMFWVVDGDAIMEKDFSFDEVMSSYDLDCVHVWRSRNPINDLEYGYGGVKLLPRKLTLEMDINSPDMTTSISKKFKAVDKISNVSAFNTDPFSTWRSAFRECCKLSSKKIDRQIEEETQNRLKIWTTVGKERLFGEYAIAGAIAGANYGESNKNNVAALQKINDFIWLEEQWKFYNERSRTAR